MYVKVEFFNPAGSVKDRLALNIIEDAERRGLLKPGQTVVEATSGNTGIGLAIVCAQKGYPLVVTMADSFSVERRKLMRMLGAKVVLTPRALKGFGMYQKAVELAEANGWFLARQFETEANADIHEMTTAREIVNDFAGSRLDDFVTGYGTGGTVTGVGRVLRREHATNAHRLERARQRAASRQRPAPAARQRWRAKRQPPRLRTAPDPGLDARFHPQRAAGGGRQASLRRGDPDRRPGGHQMGARPGPPRRHLHRHIRRGDVRHRAQIAEKAPAGSVILCMLPDTGERYLSTPLFEGIEEDMDDEERALSLSTPGFQFAA